MSQSIYPAHEDVFSAPPAHTGRSMIGSEPDAGPPAASGRTASLIIDRPGSRRRARGARSA